MKNNIETLYALYERMYNIYNEWSKTCLNNDSQWSTERYDKYRFGPVIGLYLDKDKCLIDILNDDFSDEELCALLMPVKQRMLNKLLYESGNDLITECKKKSYQDELSLLKARKVEEWMNLFFIPCIRNINFEMDESHFRGLCYITYGYESYIYSLTNIYSGDINVLKQLYKGVLGKNSELYTYKLIEITPACEMLAIDPPRVYDPRIDKTLYLSNVSKELLGVFIELGREKLYEKISLRVSNAIINIFDGKYEMQSILEAVEIGKVFSIQNIGHIPVTKLYSVNYGDCLWVKSNDYEITFEELCEHEGTFNESIITQAIHLNYLNKGNETVVTHIDHEYVFYSKSDYEKRKKNPDIKGNEYTRLKSFKIDSANIPLTLPIKRDVTLYDEATDKVLHKSETVPFIIYILKSYLRHTDLLDEYFAKL